MIHLRQRGARWVALSLAVVVTLGSCAALWIWSRTGRSDGEAIDFRVAPDTDLVQLCAELEAEQVMSHPWLLRMYLTLTRSQSRIKPGTHRLRRGLSPAALRARLERSNARPIIKLTIVEGFNRFQVAERLESLDVISRREFLAITAEPKFLRSLSIRGDSAEGYLFPATYDLRVDSDPPSLVGIFVRETRRRLKRVYQRYPSQIARLRSAEGWDDRDVLTLASIVEKEAATRDEHGLIASVFYNRLRDQNFRPRRMLQSDPTAGYGCIVSNQRIASCDGFAGVVTAPMLRDSANPYNTYKHAGLPPGPISNPSESAMEAVVNPPETPYFFFVVGPSKRHVFSRTLSEHERAIVAGSSAERTTSENQGLR